MTLITQRLVPGRRTRGVLAVGVLAATSVALVVSLAALQPPASPQAAAQSARPATAGLPNEIPAQFAPVTSGFDHVRREVMIPMRDGVKLHTVILVPNGAKRAPSSSRAHPTAPTR